MKKQKYIHGFDPTEQNRLMHQARFLEPFVYSGVDLEYHKKLLEVGCGVGAQTKILLRRFPDLVIDSVDFSKEQLDLAKIHLAQEIEQKRVRLFQQDAQKLNMKDKGQYDSAFLCWFLEHVPDPLKALKQVRKQLKKGSTIYCSEVFNQTLFLEPYSPAFLQYWFEFNDHQWTLNGHPFIGGELGNLLKQAGFVDIKTEVRPFHFDSREPEKRAAFIEYFYNILLSAEKELVAQKRISPLLLKDMKKEVQRVKKNKDAVFFYAFMRATARVP